jgi:hypothetical protein
VGSLKLWKPRGKKRWVGLRRSAATNSTPANIAAAPLNRTSVDDDTIVSLLTPTLLSNGLNNSSSYGGSEAVVRISWRLELGSELPLFTRLPRRPLLGNWASGVGNSRKLSFRHWAFSETQGIRRAGAVRPWLIYQKSSGLAALEVSSVSSSAGTYLPGLSEIAHPPQRYASSACRPPGCTLVGLLALLLDGTSKDTTPRRCIPPRG